MKINNKEKGITLLVTLLLMGVLVGVSASLMSITLKQYQLSGVAYSSEIAFQVANAGMECILYHDFPKTGASPFDVGNNEQSVACMGVATEVPSAPDANTVIGSAEEQKFQYTWGSPAVCSEVSIYKFYEAPGADADVIGPSFIVNSIDIRPGVTCPEGSSCTVIQARGYNVACAERATNTRVVEREYTQVY